MTGWRLGYCAGPREVIEMCDRLQSQTTSNATAFAQVAGIEALTGPQESVGAMAQAFEQRRNFVVAASQRHPWHHQQHPARRVLHLSQHR